MFLKLVFITLTTYCYVQGYGETTLETVEQALQEIDNITTQNQGDIHLLMDAQADILHNQLNAMVSETQQEITDQMLNITEKITVLSENVQSTTGINTDICLTSAKTDLEAFAYELNTTVLQCQGEMIKTGNDLLYTVWNRLWYEYDIYYTCRKMLLVQCRDYEEGRCPDAVYSSISGAKDNMPKIFDRIHMEMTNQIIGMHFPCRQMIVQELALYPSLILEFVRTCLDEIVASSYSISC